MTAYYQDYIWKDGAPYGITKLKEEQGISTCYKIISDSYRKHLSVEKYKNNGFESVIYDSYLFDFRNLSPLSQTAWEKIIIKEKNDHSIAYLRDQDDRLVLKEIYIFEKGLCTLCETYSIHGPLISIQTMTYQFLKDEKNRVILYDSNHHPVMYKHYEADKENGHYTEVLEECWDMAAVAKLPL